MFKMNSNISKVLIIDILFFLTLSWSHATAKTKSDIFSIVNDNVLSRRMEFTKNDTATDINNSTNKEKTTLMKYLSFISNEMNDLYEVAEHSFKEDSISLPAVYVEFSPDEIKFHDIIYDDFASFKKWPVKLETLIPDGFDPHNIKIIYESKIHDIVLTGLSEVNGTDHDFILNITDVTLRSEHERSLEPEDGNIVTKSIFETLTFKKFELSIVMPELIKRVEFPNKKILRRLADSWMVTLMNVIDMRFIRPKVRDQSQLYFDKYCNNVLLQDIGSLVFKKIINGMNFTLQDPVMSSTWELFDDTLQYKFSNITISNLSRLSNCTSKAMTVKIDESSSKENFYSHNLLFVFTDNAISNAQIRNSQSTILEWNRRMCRQGIRRESNPNELPTPIGCVYENFTLSIKYWSAVITVPTDSQGRLTGGAKVSLDFRPENYSTDSYMQYKVKQFLDFFCETIAHYDVEIFVNADSL